MQELKLTPGIKNLLDEFICGLKDIYKDDLVSVILYGSAASGEFASQHSNLNLLVVLKNTELKVLQKATDLANKPKFKLITPLFVTKEFIATSSDVFAIEFLDMKENYYVLSGEDALKDLTIDMRNLRYQCEHELKSKLIGLQQSFVSLNKNKAALRNILFRSFTSVIHILRNIIRLKGKQPRYLKEDSINQITQELPINKEVWHKILAAKNKQVRIRENEIKDLYIAFVADLDNIANF